MKSYLLKFWFSVQKIFVLSVQSPFSPLPPSKYLLYKVFFLFHLPWGGGGRNINRCRLEGSSSSLRLNSEYLFVCLLLTLPKNNMNFSHTNRTYHGQSRCNGICQVFVVRIFGPETRHIPLNLIQPWHTRFYAEIQIIFGQWIQCTRTYTLL